MRKIFIFVILIGLILVAIGLWYWQKNPYSKDILKLEILGPEQASIFQEVEYTVKYKNNGNIRLEEPKLVFEFPEYSVPPLSESAGNPGASLKRKEIGPDQLGDIYPGEEKTFTFKARLFGKEGDVKAARATMSYKPRNLNARYESATTFSTEIKPILLTFDFDLPSKVEAGRDLDFSLNYFSNLDNPLTDLGIKLEYPNGFNFASSDPKSLGENEWDIPLLNKTDGGRIKIKGKLSGNLNEQKIFRATLGVWQEDNFIPLKEITRGTEIAEPNISVFQRINGSDDYTANPGDMLHYEIFFRNINNNPFNNLFLVTKLEGALFDLDSIKVESGKFSKGDNSIVWDWRDVPKLAFLGQGEEGKVEFWVNLKDISISSPQQNSSVLKDTVLVSQAQEKFEIKVNSKLMVTQRALYQDEVFGNTGSVPPRVGKPTTYTIMWDVKNYYNTAKNITVKATLPDNVKLTGNFFPASESSNFSFDNNSREIVWRVGNQGLNPGAGILNQAPSISFQVSLIPNSNQIGVSADIISEAKIKGDDQWTGQVIESSSPGENTNLKDDPISGNKGGVQP